MNDNDIILGLKCLADEDEILCKDCAFRDMDHGFDCKKNVSKAAIDLINRQKAEIERLIDLASELTEYNEAWLADNVDLRVKLKTAKAEAIKEFAERLKRKSYITKPYAFLAPQNTKFEMVDVCDIDNLVKEMTEEIK